MLGRLPPRSAPWPRLRARAAAVPLLGVPGGLEDPARSAGLCGKVRAHTHHCSDPAHDFRVHRPPRAHGTVLMGLCHGRGDKSRCYLVTDTEITQSRWRGVKQHCRSSLKSAGGGSYNRHGSGGPGTACHTAQAPRRRRGEGGPGRQEAASCRRVMRGRARCRREWAGRGTRKPPGTLRGGDLRPPLWRAAWRAPQALASHVPTKSPGLLPGGTALMAPHVRKLVHGVGL